MTILRSNRKCLREYLVSADEAARFLKVTGFRFRQLVADGFITPANRKGFYRLGAVLDGALRAKSQGGATEPLSERHSHLEALNRLRREGQGSRLAQATPGQAAA